MKYCSHCGNEIMDDAVVCVKCGCSTTPNNQFVSTPPNFIQQLSDRVKINGIIWLIIGILQALLGLTINWVLLIVGALNIISSVQDLNYSKEVLNSPAGIVEKFKPLTGPIIVLVYNLLFGGIIGVVGSIYYLVGVRNFVLSNESSFSSN